MEMPEGWNTYYRHYEGEEDQDMLETLNLMKEMAEALSKVDSYNDDMATFDPKINEIILPVLKKFKE